MTQKNGRSENFMIRALYLIAIVFVVDGHTPFKDMFDWGGLFGYYSFHLRLGLSAGRGGGGAPARLHRAQGAPPAHPAAGVECGLRRGHGAAAAPGRL